MSGKSKTKQRLSKIFVYLCRLIFKEMESRYDTRLVISCKSLSNESHRFEFHINSAFFDAYGNTDIHSAELIVQVALRKMGAVQFEVSVGITGTASVPCDRCLDPVDIQVNYRADMAEEEIEEAYNTDLGEMDLGQYVYDSVCVSIPIQRIHRDETLCNRQMLDIWKKNSGGMTAENGAFAALKELINNNK